MSAVLILLALYYKPSLSRTFETSRRTSGAECGRVDDDLQAETYKHGQRRRYLHTGQVMEREMGSVCALHAAQAEARHVRGTVRRDRLHKKKLKSWLERKPRRIGSNFLLSYCKRNQQCSEAHQLHLSEWDHTLRLEGCLCCCNPAYGKRIKLSFSAATQALVSPKRASFYRIHLFLHTSLKVSTSYIYCNASLLLGLASTEQRENSVHFSDPTLSPDAARKASFHPESFR